MILGRSYVIRMAEAMAYQPMLSIIEPNEPPTFPTPSKRQRIARKKRNKKA